MADLYPKLPMEYYSGPGCNPGSVKDALTRQAMSAPTEYKTWQEVPAVDSRRSVKAGQGMPGPARGIRTGQTS